MTLLRSSMPFVALIALSACAASTPPPAKTPPVSSRPAPNPYLNVASTAPMDLAGKDARALTGLFGQPRLDVREGAGRKLQFLNERCVLDTYLYTPRAGQEAVVSHAEARDRTGIDMSASACAAMLKR